MLETGTVLQNRYRIEKQIGQGGMGKVYVATDERFKSTVAIKETVFEDINLRKAFEREARLLNSLRHSALPRVSDHFTEEDGQFLVMEYITGEDLAEMMERDGEAFSSKDVLNWANQLCGALDYLHAQDIIHRDIKPQNLKLTPNGQIVLLDFGLAKGNPTDARHQTAAKSIFGYSRSYASLEQIQGTGTEPRSDLYSLSATLYHLLTGIPPADALTRAMNVLNGQSDPLIAANLVNKKISHGVADVLQKAMALNASERPKSATAMRSMLEKSNKNIAPNAANSAPDQFSTVDLLTQETKIMSSATNAPNINNPEGKTKILPEETNEKSLKTNVIGAKSDSVVTKVQSAAENAKSPKRARAFGATVFGGLLLVGSAISAVYLYNPGVYQSNANLESTNSANQNNFVITVENNSNLSSADAAVENAKAEQETANDQSKQAQPVETAKKNLKQTKDQTKNSQNGGKSKKTGGNENDIILNEDSIETQGLIIDENGIRMKNPPVPPRPGKKLPPEQLKYLSPEQIRKLEQMENGKHRVIIVEKPTPKPTP